MTEEIYEKLSSLIQLDIDAANAYEEAIEKCDDTLVREHLETFKDDHQRHIDELSAYIADYDMEPPEQTPDLKGVLIEGFTSLRSSTGTEGALKAMRTNEKMTNKKYSDAMEWDLDLDAKDIVMRGYEDEKTHLAYIEEQLTVRAK